MSILKCFEHTKLPIIIQIFFFKNLLHRVGSPERRIIVLFGVGSKSFGFESSQDLHFLPLTGALLLCYNPSKHLYKINRATTQTGPCFKYQSRPHEEQMLQLVRRTDASLRSQLQTSNHASNGENSKCWPYIVLYKDNCGLVPRMYITGLFLPSELKFILGYKRLDQYTSYPWHDKCHVIYCEIGGFI